MKNTFNPIHIIIIILSISLTACANGYRDFYKNNTDENISGLVLLESGQKPQIAQSSNPDRDINNLLAKNFRIIGQSSFNGKMHTDEDVIAQATRVRATHVLYGSKFVATQAISTPLFTPNGLGGINTTAFTNQQMRYDQWAYYFAKSKTKLRFGLFAEDLTPDERKAIGSNTGVAVRLVVEDTPAFYANIFKDDVITHLNNQAVLTAEQLSTALSSIAADAQSATFTIIRNSEKIVVNVDLRAQVAN